MARVAMRGLNKKYDDVHAVIDVNLDIHDQEFVVLVGPSGCGKTTTLRMVAGLESITGGHITIDEKVVNELPPMDRDIAMVFQNYALYPHMTVFENMSFGLRLRHLPKEQIRERVERAAGILGIGELLARRPRQLSGGQRQRVAMGRAIVRDPKVFLFDEPLSNLDAKLRVEMRMEIKRLHQRLGSTIVYVTHDQIEAMTLATRIAVMNHGEIQQFADPDTVYNRPANLFVARFMGAPPMNTLPARIVATDGGLQAEIGGGIRLPVPVTPRATDYAGREVILGIRPECIAEPNRRFEDGSVPVEATVEMTEPTGAETIVLLRLGGHEVLGRVAPDIRLKPGDVARFAFDTRKICLFDPKSERLID